MLIDCCIRRHWDLERGAMAAAGRRRPWDGGSRGTEAAAMVDGCMFMLALAITY